VTPPAVERAAAAYRDAVDHGTPPVAAVAAALQVSRSTAGRRIRAARDVGLLPSAQPGRIAAYPGEHRPRRARWIDASASWLACASCRRPWPCPGVER
jgi:transposase